MSVLIKGMEMPKSCAKCFMCQSDCMGCKVTQNFIILKKGQNKPTWCPLIEVPPHGRLIDMEEIGEASFNTLPTDMIAIYQRGWNDAISAIVNNARTIIEAEGEENG